ncbi:MAG: transposase [Oligoflexus sp.]|nr:transposase [Oligoflexus sp.]
MHYFKGLYIYEKALDLNGRNALNVRTVRHVDSRQMWEDIRCLATITLQKSSKATKLGAAAFYILRHFAKLTAYLDNTIISISNNFSERMLRMENLIEANALFRNSLEARFALDINRSILQTAIAAGATLQDYLNFILRASPAEVSAHRLGDKMCKAYLAIPRIHNYHRFKMSCKNRYSVIFLFSLFEN